MTDRFDISLIFETAMHVEQGKKYMNGHIHDIMRMPYVKYGHIILSIVMFNDNTLFMEIDDTRSSDHPYLIRMEEFDELEQAIIQGYGIKHNAIRHMKEYVRNRANTT